MNGIDNDRHPLWRLLVGPYWHLECFIFKLSLLSGVLYLLFLAWRNSKDFRQEILQSWILHKKEREEKRLEAAAELQRAQWAQDLAAEKARFEALPAEEKARIEQERRALLEQRRLEKQREFEELQKKEAEDAAKIAAEKAKAQAKANQPENKRKRAVSSFVGPVK